MLPIIEITDKLNNKESLSADHMRLAMEAIISGAVPTEAIEAFLLALRRKGESVTEIVAAVRVMRQHVLALPQSYPDLLDTCGTGGDGKHSVNVSTLAALAACAAGARIAKHGNRSVSSNCGSADLLEMLGVKIDLSPERVASMIDRTGFGFFFAPHFHPAVKYAMPARKRIQGKTIFNILGPLSNPAGTPYQLIGVYEERWVEVLAKALCELGSKSAMVVHGLDGLDEISVSGKTLIARLDGGKIKVSTVKPEDFGITASPINAICCQSKEENKALALKILKGEKGPGLDIVSLNAAAALCVAGKAATIKEGVSLAMKALESGAAYRKLGEIAAFSIEPV